MNTMASMMIAPIASSPSQETTAVIMTKVAKDAEDDFMAWQERIEAVQSKAPGYLGCEVQPPVPGFQEEWVTMLRFDSPDNLNAWLEGKADFAGEIELAGRRIKTYSLEELLMLRDRYAAMAANEAAGTGAVRRMVVRL